MERVVPDLERSVARCRLLLSVTTLVAVWIDPTEPALFPWLGLTGGPFTIDLPALAALGLHLFVSVAIYVALDRGFLAAARTAAVTPWIDVLFGALIAVFTEGASSPFYTFFGFAVISAGVRGNYRQTIAVTAASVVLYLGLILVSVSQTVALTRYVMRPVYLALLGYLAAYLGRERLALDGKLHVIEQARERSRIARVLHDGCVQTLAGTNLILKACRELVRRGREAEALSALADLEASFTREYGGLRNYVRALADLEASPDAGDRSSDTRVTMRVEFAGSAHLAHHVVHIVREALANIQRHAQARSAAIVVENRGEELRITVDDDGVGLPEGGAPPWSIASRVHELKGRIQPSSAHVGAHLVIDLPLG
jgi:signal transduction histidine kinase